MDPQKVKLAMRCFDQEGQELLAVLSGWGPSNWWQLSFFGLADFSGELFGFIWVRYWLPSTNLPIFEHSVLQVCVVGITLPPE